MDRLRLPELAQLASIGKGERSSKAAEALLRYLEAEHEMARRPLFILGAGISAGQVPFLSEMAAHLADKIDEAVKRTPHQSPDAGSLTFLANLGRKISEGNALRSDAAEFFFTLQGSSSKRIRNTVKDIWQTFSHDLLSGGNIKRTGAGKCYGPIQDAVPTEAHKLIASQLIKQKAWCISFNFDRLTARAIHSVSEENQGCAVLHTQEQVDGYFSAPRHDDTLPVVFKVRGDVFYASCSRPGCALRQSPVPLHAFLRSGRPVDDKPRPTTTPERREQTCPDCNVGNLVLQLSFPGFRAKEEEAFPLLCKIASYIHHRVSAIIIIGFSGHWDDYILEFLCDISVRAGIPIIDVKPDVDRPKNPISEFIGVHPGQIIYLPIKSRADEFAQTWQKASEKLRPRAPILSFPKVNDEEGFVRGDEFGSEHVWLRDGSSSLSLKLERPEEIAARDGDTKEENRTISIKLDEVRGCLENQIPGFVKRRLSSSAQLAIDNIVLTGEIGEHNRWNHSLGVTIIGLLWYRRLAEDLKIPEDRRKETETTLATALLLHDYGHLPFSHLSEQVIDEINWTSPLHQLFGSEFNVLYNRLFSPKESEEGKIKRFLETFEHRAGVRSEGGATILLRLIGGFYSEPWLSAIVNSAIDADKVDYVFRDICELTRPNQSEFSFQTRLAHSNPDTWLSEFLSDQRVNQHGILCLDGRSAMAMVQLLEERTFLYRYLYRAPEVRLAERMASEFVRQFLIQGVWERAIAEPNLLLNHTHDADLRRFKNNQLQELLEHDYGEIGYREGKEWLLLEKIRSKVLEFPMDNGYRELLEKIWQHLEMMRSRKRLAYLRSKLQDGLLVESPFYFKKSDFSSLRQLIRPLQHQYCRDVLFDLVSLPPFLSGPKPLRLNLWHSSATIDAINILVPKGPPDEWNFRSTAQVPLSVETFRKRQDDICMVYIFDPFEGTRPQAYYALDKFVAACKREGLHYSTDAGGNSQ